MGLAGSGWSQGDDVLASFDPAAPRQLQHLYIVERRDRFEVEAIQAFRRGELCGLDPAFHHAPFPFDQFELDQAAQIGHVPFVLSGTLSGLLLVLAQHRGQFELLEVISQQKIGDLIQDAPSDS